MRVVDLKPVRCPECDNDDSLWLDASADGYVDLEADGSEGSWTMDGSYIDTDDWGGCANCDWRGSREQMEQASVAYHLRQKEMPEPIQIHPNQLSIKEVMHQTDLS